MTQSDHLTKIHRKDEIIHIAYVSNYFCYGMEKRRNAMCFIVICCTK